MDECSRILEQHVCRRRCAAARLSLCVSSYAVTCFWIPAALRKRVITLAIPCVERRSPEIFRNNALLGGKIVAVWLDDFVESALFLHQQHRLGDDAHLY